MEKYVPYYKRLTDAAHEMGLYFELHSCGKNEALVPAYIAAGFDWWAPQPINDVDMLLEKHKDAPFFFACQTIGLRPGADEAEQVRVATAWFEKYKDKKVFTSFMDATPLMMDTIYRLSREYYNN